MSWSCVCLGVSVLGLGVSVSGLGVSVLGFGSLGVFLGLIRLTVLFVCMSRPLGLVCMSC